MPYNINKLKGINGDVGNGKILQTPSTTVSMFHRATKMKLLTGTSLEMVFQDGKVFRYDLSRLFDKYPGMKKLKNRELFLSAKMTAYGIRWSEDLDLEAETIYENGEFVRLEQTTATERMAIAIKEARQKAQLSQSELAELTGINQADISKIECGLANPSLLTLERIADALKKELVVKLR